jgi:hypothetical protein
MPSSKNYVRNYKQEAAAEDDERRAQRVKRVQARRKMIAAGKAKVGDGKDVGHKRALSRGGKNGMSNLIMQAASENRSFKRRSNGSMQSETSTKERKRRG